MGTTSTSRWSAGAAVATLVLTFGGVGVGVGLEVRATRSSIHPADVALVAAFLSLPAVGSLLVWRRPANALGWLLASTGALGGCYLALHGWAVYALRTRPGEFPGGSVAAWLVTWWLVPAFGVLPYVAATFPSGHIERTTLRRFGYFTVVALACLATAQAFAPDTLDGVDPGIRPIPNPLGVDALEGVLSTVTAVSGTVVVAFAVAAIVDAGARYRRSSGDERRQLRAVAFFPGLIPGTILLSGFLPEGAGVIVVGAGQIVGLLGLSAAIAVAVLRYRLYDLGGYLRRTAVYVALSAAVVVLVVAVASLVGVLLPLDGAAPAAIAAAGVALALGPWRSRLQRGIDRLLFGRRDEPYSVLAAVGAGLEASLSPEAALTGMVEAVATSLRVPYVAIEPGGDGPDRHAVRYGEAGGPATRLALVHQHRRLGDLVVGHRSADEAFTAAEVQLLRNLARQVAVAVRAATVTADLRLARLELVRGREEERRRLRRDIHDGLGPTLAGTMLQLDTLRELIADGPAEAQALAAKVKANLRTLVDDVRRVSHDLRPPALDELGLAGALREQVQSLTTGSGLDVVIDLPTTSRSPAAATEVAVYRIVSEALANVVRHADARHCTVRLRVGDEVEVTVVDDGIGVPDGATPGLGLASMRERAAELGGTCDIEPIEPSGTRVHARLPLSP